MTIGPNLAGFFFINRLVIFAPRWRSPLPHGAPNPSIRILDSPARSRILTSCHWEIGDMCPPGPASESLKYLKWPYFANERSERGVSTFGVLIRTVPPGLTNFTIWRKNCHGFSRCSIISRAMTASYVFFNWVENSEFRSASINGTFSKIPKFSAVISQQVT